MSLNSAGRRLTGTQGDENNSAEIFDGTVSGNDVAWKVTVTDPFPLTLKFRGTVAGDAITGKMDIGFMGTYPFKAKRA